MQKREKKKDSWNYFLECSGKPKLTSQIDLNAYLNQFKQNTQLQYYQKNWQAFLEKIQFALDVFNLLLNLFVKIL